MRAKRIAVIPARGGSKRIPRKNIRAFCGRPIITWSIQGALDAGCFDEIIVSTDDQEIASVAEAAGATVPFLRPAPLANDFATTADVMKHAVEWLREELKTPLAAVCCIYATAPLIDAGALRAAGERLLGAGHDYVFSGAAFTFPIQRALKVGSDEETSMFFPEYAETRSQDLEPAFHDAGQFYWGTPEAWLERRPIYGARSRLLVLSKERVQDIDTLDDWEYAERLFLNINTND